MNDQLSGRPVVHSIANRRARFGPVIEPEGVWFQLWAPGAKEVSLVVQDRAPLHLLKDSAGFWETRCEAAAGARYHFEVDGTKIPDPASRFQPEDVHGPSQVLASDGYVWRHPGWTGLPWECTVLYELHVGTSGGYEGVKARLADLAALGITAVELMPLGDFAGGRNWGYDGVLPFAPDHSYGTPDELRALIDEAHGLGMMVFLDVVYNHFGPDGNWLPAYASEFFDQSEHTPWGAAIDFRHEVVRRFFTENALYWLDSFRFDGLRLDAVQAILDRSWLLEMAGEVRETLAGRHVHLVLENENNDAGLLQAGFDAQWNDDFHNVMHVVLTGEGHAYYRDFAAEPMQKLVRCLSEGFIYQGEVSINHPGRTRGEASGHLPPTAFVGFLQNHDQVGNRALGERLTVLTSQAKLKAAMALLLLSPHIPLLFMGEEVGAREPFLFFTDFQGELGDAVRDGRRREFAHSPGFADDQATSRIPDPNDVATFAASRWTDSAPDAVEWKRLIHDLLAIRRRLIVPGLPGCRALGAEIVGEACVVARWRLGDGAILTVASNFGGAEVAVSLPAASPIFGVRPPGKTLQAETTIAWLEANA